MLETHSLTDIYGENEPSGEWLDRAHAEYLAEQQALVDATFIEGEPRTKEEIIQKIFGDALSVTTARDQALEARNYGKYLN